MKALLLPTSIISLENVRRADIVARGSKHTSYGKPYILTTYSIEITYNNQTSESIDFGYGDNAKDLCEATFKLIYEKLSGENFKDSKISS